MCWHEEAKLLLIKNGWMIDPSQKINGKKNILIEDGKIKKILPSNTTPQTADEVIDAKNHIVAPGLVDIHTHLREPGQEHKETIQSGSAAAAAGGFTSVVCMANTDPVNDTAYITQYIRYKAQRESCVNVFPVGALSKGLKGEELAEIGSLKEAGCVAISDDGRTVMNSYLMRKALEYCKYFDLTIISHCEDLHLVGQGVMNEGRHSTLLGLRGNPAASEEIMVARDVALSEWTAGRVHIAHVSTPGALRILEDAKKRKVPITAEVTPHHLFLTEDHVASYNTDFKMAPPLRTEPTLKQLRMALKTGVIDCFATDHAPHSVLEKNVEFEMAAPGVIGLETALPVTLKLVEEKILTLSQWVHLWTDAPANILKLPKGTLKIGADADVIIFDPKASVTIDREKLKSKSKNTPFHGWQCHGKVKYTFVGGQCVYRD